MKKTALIVVLVGLAAGGAWFASKGRDRERGEPRGRPVKVERGVIERTVEANGSVVPLNRVEVRPPIGGRIEQLLAEEGGRVKAGDIIAWMSSNDRAAILDAARAQGEAEVARWREAYKPTPIIAPLSGNVILRNVVVGQTVDANTVLYAMADTLIVVAQVDESEIGRVTVGMPVRIVLDAYPDDKVPGKVASILFEGKNVSNVITYGVKVKPDRVPDFFRSQMTANVSFIAGRKEDALLLPAAVVQDAPGGGKRVLVRGPDGKPEPKEVTVGIESGDLVEILSGLEDGDRVLQGRGRYVPQEGPQASPLAGGNRPAQAQQGQAPRQRQRSQR